MASLYPKKINGKTYWYLREMARVQGKPKMVSERYLGSAADIAAAVAGGEAAMRPERTRHLAFGDVAAVWGVMTRLDVIGIVDAVTGGTVAGAGASTGTYLALAALNRVVAPCSQLALAQWWQTTAADRFTKIGTSVLDHRRFWDAMHAVSLAELGEIERRVTAAMIERFDLDTSALALDMTNFATYLDTGNAKAPIAQRGKAKQKRSDLRLVGLGLVVTRDGGIPLVSHAYAGNRPDVTQFATVIEKLTGGYQELLPAGTDPHPDTGAPTGAGEVTVVFDAGQNSTANFAYLAQSGLHYVGSVPPSDHPDLLALPASRRRPVDDQRFPGLTALTTRRQIYGADRRVVLTHSVTLHDKQVCGFDQTLATAGARLDDLAATLARGKTRRPRKQVEAEIAGICRDTWARRVIDWELTGDTPAEHRLSWHIDTRARTTLQREVFGKRVLITDHEHWPIAEVVAGYRSQSDAEFGFRQLKDPHVVSFSPMHHPTDHNIRVHVFTCVLALQLAHLLRRQADQHGLHLSVRELLDTLAGIQETVLIHPSTGGRPKDSDAAARRSRADENAPPAPFAPLAPIFVSARRMLTETSTDQAKLIDIFNLQRWAPRS